MQIRPAKPAARARGAKFEEPEHGQWGPVVVLEPDHVAAGALQTLLTEYGFEWIAIVHELADARRIVAAAPVRLAMLSLDRRAAEVLAMAQELDKGRIPLILTSATGKPLIFPGLPSQTPILARGCPREMLFAAFDAARLRLGRSLE
jgi:hypothetical protein